VLVIETQGGRGKGSGIEWEGRFAMVYDLEGGRITRWTVYDDLPKAFQDLGLS
jgi:ketosteroid isomerase-like protein